MPRKVQNILYNIAEILNAWSCIDVFVIALIAGVVQIGQFALFLVGDKCDFIDPFIKKYFSNILGVHNSCFYVQTYLSEGSWIFLVRLLRSLLRRLLFLKFAEML